MAETVVVPGTDPSAAIPPGAVPAALPPGAAIGIPPVPPATQQKPGFVEPVKPADPAAADPAKAEFEQFLAWKAANEAKKADPAVVVPPKASPGPEDTLGAAESLEAVRNAAAADPYLSATFDLFSLVAPKADLARAVGNALDRGDPTLIDKAYLREVAPEQADRLIKTAEGLVKHVTQAVERLTSDIHTLAGGEAQFNAAVAVFNQKAPKFMREAVANSINSAVPERVRTAVEGMLDFVKQQGGVPRDPQGHVRAGGGAPDQAQALTKAEFQRLHYALDRSARDYEAQSQSLLARRQLGKNLGMK